MKKINIILVAVFLTTLIWAQTPSKMSYQAVIRDGGGILITNQGVGMRISILKGSGLIPVYVETQTATTNAIGLVAILIGDGSVVSGSFATIDWSADKYSIKTETDPTIAGGTNYTIVGISQLLSVPYALNAKTAENSFSGNYNDLTNRPNLFDGNYNSLSNLPTLFSGTYSDLLGRPILWDSTWASIKNKPTFFDGQFSSLTGAPTNVSSFTNDAGYLTSFTELDPKVGSNTFGYSPKWDGSSLVAGAIFQDAIGRIGIGKTSPQTTLDITSTNTTDAVIQLKNFNDPIGAVLINTYNSVQLGMFNPSSTDLNQLPAGSGRSFFGFDPTGKVGSLTNYYYNNAYRNLLDDGNGNAFFTGNVGVGNSTPTNKLDVNGDVNTSGAFKINGTPLASVASSGSYTDLINKPTIPDSADGSETKINAGTNIIVAGTGTVASPYIINSTSFTHYIGELYGGGIIIAVWKESGIEKGLVASLTNISTGCVWSNVSSTLLGVSYTSDGLANTNAIIAQPGHITSAALLCKNYNAGGFNDWYLPSEYELNLCKNAAFFVNNILGDANGFKFAVYWSSTESYNTYSWSMYFGGGGGTDYPKSNAYYVRAVRRF